ncbi:hypothetical protein EDB19DRAFT_1643704 [Suillus lakei]|nr:hypothetical protein EDB19DRAFT_1643704 [Suillus lakei]
MKSHGAYRTSDLPPAMQADQRWTKKFIPTIMMWAGSYDDIWSIPDDVLLHHVQLVFDVVYPELKIVIVHGGVIHLLTAQRISEWRSNFGSTGIVIIIDFLSHNADCDSSTLASSLLANWAFLYEDPDNINPLTAYRSPFILQLYGRAHLNAINGHVVIPSFDMQALDTIGMSRVLALSAAALERTLGMIACKELEVQDILPSASRGKFTIKLPKVLNKATGKKTNAPFLFSAARWSKATNSYIKSILSKPAGYVEATAKMARTALQDDIETLGSLIEDDKDEDERAMICKFYSLRFHPANITYHCRICLQFVVPSSLLSCGIYPSPSSSMPLPFFAYLSFLGVYLIYTFYAFYVCAPFLMTGLCRFVCFF